MLKTVLVTGDARIGRATALRLAAEGVRIAVNYHAMNQKQAVLRLLNWKTQGNR
ncbi:MAG: hypothetical protein R3C02_20010 [Planctomycetaceae bacterium]